MQFIYVNFYSLKTSLNCSTLWQNSHFVFILFSHKFTFCHKIMQRNRYKTFSEVCRDVNIVLYIIQNIWSKFRIQRNLAIFFILGAHGDIFLKFKTLTFGSSFAANQTAYALLKKYATIHRLWRQHTATCFGVMFYNNDSNCTHNLDVSVHRIFAQSNSHHCRMLPQN